jgi:hypothetical protein
MPEFGPLMEKLTRIQVAPFLWVGVLTALVSGGWLFPGYFFGTDFPGPRHFEFPNALASYAGFQAALALLALVFPGEIVGKILVIGVLFVAGLTAYYAVPVDGFVPRAVGSLAYLLNPFVYDRLAYGQLNVLAGYAVLPWAVLSIRQLLFRPSAMPTMMAALAMTVIAILDVHLALIAAAVGGCLVVAHVAIDVRAWSQVAQLGRSLAVGMALTLGASAYWIVPLILGKGPQADVIARIGQSDLIAFKAASDPTWGLIPNILGLYGFWAEQTGRFEAMKLFVPGWPVILAVLLLMVIVGAVGAWSEMNSLRFNGARAWAVGLLGAAIVAVILEMGVSNPHTASIVGWLDVVFPAYRGLRDPSKWAAVLALLYSQAIPVGYVVVANWLKTNLGDRRRVETSTAVLVAVVIALPLYYGNGLLYSLHGQVKTSFYPAGWYMADQVLTADPHPGRAIFLPWHGYMGLSFVRNANRVVACPAPTFFSVPVVASQDLEVPGIPAPLDEPDQAFVASLVAAQGQGNWALELAAHDFKYVLLAREADWTGYEYLHHVDGLVLVGDYQSILLYRNVLWSGP